MSSSPGKEGKKECDSVLMGQSKRSKSGSSCRLASTTSWFTAKQVGDARDTSKYRVENAQGTNLHPKNQMMYRFTTEYSRQIQRTKDSREMIIDLDLVKEWDSGPNGARHHGVCVY